MAGIRRRGVRLDSQKSYMIKAEISECDGGDTLYVPVREPCKITVSPADCVVFEQPLAYGEDGCVYYCPCNGIVTEIVTQTHPIASDCSYIRVARETDGQALRRPADKPESGFSPEDFAGIIDPMDMRSLTAKLREFSATGKKRLAVCAAEDQPYVCPDSAVLFNSFDRVEYGLRIAAQSVGITQTEIFACANKAFADAVPSFDGKITFLSGKYPMRYPLLHDNSGKTGFLSARVCEQLCALVSSGAVQTDTVVTVAGPYLQTPRNLRAKLGTPIGALLDENNPDVEQPGIVVLGGPMNGKYVSDLNTPLCLGMDSVLLMEPPHFHEIANCWGCAQCVNSCPQNLMPLYIARFARHNMLDDCEDFGVLRCIECGCCSYVCTGGVDPMMFIAEAKRTILERRNLGSQPDGRQTADPASRRLTGGKGGTR